MPVLSDDHYRTLASIRHELRRFIHFSEQAASGSGVTAQQHQALLAIRAAGGEMLVGRLAEQLLLRPHSASEHVDRLEKLGHVVRKAGKSDGRQVGVSLTIEGEALLSSLSLVHLEELRRIRPLLIQLVEQL